MQSPTEARPKQGQHSRSVYRQICTQASAAFAQSQLGKLQSNKWGILEQPSEEFAPSLVGHTFTAQRGEAIHTQLSMTFAHICAQLSGSIGPSQIKLSRKFPSKHPRSAYRPGNCSICPQPSGEVGPRLAEHSTQPIREFVPRKEEHYRTVQQGICAQTSGTVLTSLMVYIPSQATSCAHFHHCIPAQPNCEFAPRQVQHLHTA